MACREVSTWITENVLVPVERFLTEAREACEEMRRWVEEQVQQPVESWISQTERHCREQDCNWWCLCCNKWFCWLVTVVVRVVTWVVVTIGKWVAYLVCKIVVTVIGIVVDLVLKVITRLVTFFVCLFTDPLKALSTIWDLFNDIVDAVDEVFGLAVSLLDDVKEIINDVKTLVDGIGRSFCIFGKELCAFFTAIFGAISGLLAWASDIVDWVQDVIQGVRDLVGGILSLDWCRIQRALGILNVFRVIGSVTRIPGTIFYAGPKGLIDVDTIQSKIDAALNEAFGSDAERLARSRDRANLGGSPIGLPCALDPRRLAIRSSEFLRRLATGSDRALDLYSIAGRFTTCQGKFVYDQFDGEIVYTGTTTTVTKTDIDDFLSLGPDAVPSFTVYPIKQAVFRRHLETATRKGTQIGLRLNWRRPVDLPISDARFVPLASDDGSLGDAVQKDLLRVMGRPDDEEPLEVIPVIAIFGYVTTSLHGLTSWFRPAVSATSPTGTTFRSRFPEVVFQYVPIHEIGHYVGLDHDPHDSAGEIMWKPSQPTDWGASVLNYLVTTGEANFTLDDVDVVWRWITTNTAVRDRFLP
jgi:hypothetical protein